MTRSGNIAGFVLLVAAGMGLAYTGWQIRRSSTAEFCSACQRSIHPQMRTLAQVGGRSVLFCCPTCALTSHSQTGEPVRITRLTDFNTGAALSPQDAYLVEGSSVNLCVQEHVLMEQNKQAAPMQFDRCSPSILAFSRREAAADFQREHGGTVLPFAELASSYQH